MMEFEALSVLEYSGRGHPQGDDDDGCDTDSRTRTRITEVLGQTRCRH
jgi:hypothetical protein